MYSCHEVCVQSIQGGLRIFSAIDVMSNSIACAQLIYNTQLNASESILHVTDVTQDSNMGAMALYAIVAAFPCALLSIYAAFIVCSRSTLIVNIRKCIANIAQKIIGTQRIPVYSYTLLDQQKLDTRNYN